MMITKNPFALLLFDIHTTFLQNFKKIGDIEFFHLVHLAYFAPYIIHWSKENFRWLKKCIPVFLCLYNFRNWWLIRFFRRLFPRWRADGIKFHFLYSTYPLSSLCKIYSYIYSMHIRLWQYVFFSILLTTFVLRRISRYEFILDFMVRTAVTV